MRRHPALPTRPQAAGGTVADLLSRAALFGALARAFHYPAAERLAALRAALAQQLEARRRAGPDPVRRALRAARAALEDVSASALEPEYVRLFLTSVTSPLHETAYGDGRRMAGRTAEIADISGFYLAFGLTPSEREPDLPDHLCTELEFYSLLLVKQAYAANHRWNERRRIAERAAATFMETHLGRWVRAFAESLLEQAPPPAYRALARLLVTTIEQECRRLRVRPQLLSGRIGTDEMQAESFVCPHEAAAPAPAFGGAAVA